jgi:hypothetical protein
VKDDFDDDSSESQGFLETKERTVRWEGRCMSLVRGVYEED